jgi:hypothetical protein
MACTAVEVLLALLTADGFWPPSDRSSTIHPLTAVLEASFSERPFTRPVRFRPCGRHHSGVADPGRHLRTLFQIFSPARSIPDSPPLTDFSARGGLTSGTRYRFRNPEPQIRFAITAPRQGYAPLRLNTTTTLRSRGLTSVDGPFALRSPPAP